MSQDATPRPAARRVGIADVAALAGVSVGTASKALNGRGTLREETRARVRSAAAELGVTPSVVARNLLPVPVVYAFARSRDPHD